jgi:hypothetical protein
MESNLFFCFKTILPDRDSLLGFVPNLFIGKVDIVVQILLS